MTFCLASTLLLCYLSAFDEISCHVGEAHMAQDWRKSLAKCQKGTEALSQTDPKELNPANNPAS